MTSSVGASTGAGAAVKPVEVTTNDGKIQITVNTTNTNNVGAADKKDEKKDGGGHLIGKTLYRGIEFFLIHGEMLTRKDGVYRATYLTGLIAGLGFGAYDALYRKNLTSGLEERATAFSKTGIGQKLMMISELTIWPFAMAFAESQPYELNDKHIYPYGNLVASYCGFNLGADLSRAAMKYVKS